MKEHDTVRFKHHPTTFGTIIYLLTNGYCVVETSNGNLVDTHVDDLEMVEKTSKR